MQTDLYTKTVLTIIAMCLTLICARELNLVQSVHAEEQVKVPVMEVEVVNIPTVRLAYDHEEDDYRLPVSIEGVRLPSDEALPILIDDVRHGIVNKLPTK